MWFLVTKKNLYVHKYIFNCSRKNNEVSLSIGFAATIEYSCTLSRNDIKNDPIARLLSTHMKFQTFPLRVDECARRKVALEVVG